VNIADEYIVVLNEFETDASGRARSLAAAHGGNIKRIYKSALKGFSIHMSAQQAEEMASDPAVDFIEPDSRVSIAGVQSSPPSWGLDRIDQTKLPLDWTYSYGGDGAGVNVYIIDTGIRHTHVEFGSRVVPAFSSITDGYGPDGCNWHGTHVAGIVGGATVGVAKAATLYSVRVLDCNGSGTNSEVIAGIDWVAANRRLPAVANMSTSGDLSAALTAAIENAINSGVTFVVAAGNAASDACNYSPSNVTAALTVGATTWQDAAATYSNFGPCLDLYAPGDGITSATNVSDDLYYQASGTSMATPHVTGAAALYLQSFPGASPATVNQAILANASAGVVSSIGRTTPNLLVRTTGFGLPGSPSSSTPTTSFVVSCARNKNDCAFDGSASSDPQGITSYSWNFGDNTSLTGSTLVKPRHTYSSRGSYTVVLTVSDAAGNSASAQRTVTVKGVR
jgi:serine protease